MTLTLKEIKNTSIDASNKPLLVMTLVLNIQNILDNRYNENPKSFEKSFSSLTKRRNPSVLSNKDKGLQVKDIHTLVMGINQMLKNQPSPFIKNITFCSEGAVFLLCKSYKEISIW
ncbi:hypothetical protein ACU64K_01875 [Enterococcus faecium]